MGYAYISVYREGWYICRVHIYIYTVDMCVHICITIQSKMTICTALKYKCHDNTKVFIQFNSKFKIFPWTVSSDSSKLVPLKSSSAFLCTWYLSLAFKSHIWEVRLPNCLFYIYTHTRKKTRNDTALTDNYKTMK